MRNIFFFITVFILPFISFSQNFTEDRYQLDGDYNAFRSCTDIHHYNLDIDVDIYNRYLNGKVEATFTYLEKSDTIQFDLNPDFYLDTIAWEDKQFVSYDRNKRAILLPTPNQWKVGKQYTISISYKGEAPLAVNPPWDGGFIFSYHGEDVTPWVGVACQGIGASTWWPCKDHVKDEPDSVTFSSTVDNSLVFVSNGKLIDEKRIGEDKTKYTWKVTNPINLYSVTMNISDYYSFFNTYQSKDGILECRYYVLPENFDVARKHFEQVRKMLQAFEYYFGPYPFIEDSYKLVETPYLGMEHQSCIAYGNQYMEGYLGNDPSELGWDFIIVHESGHEWFGNLVSSADQADLWIHEAFCTYTETLFTEYWSDKQTAQKYINWQREQINNLDPLVRERNVAFHDWKRDADIYYKGAWMIHTIRNMVNNDQEFFKVLKGFVEKFAHKPVLTEDVIEYFSSNLTDFNLKPVFQHYLYEIQIPALLYKLTEEKGRAYLEYRWDTPVTGFEMPFEYEYRGKRQRGLGTQEWNRVYLGKSKKGFKFNMEAFLVDLIELEDK